MSKIISASQKPAIDDDDQPFVWACQRGDTEAFAVLVKRHSPKMLNLASRLLSDYDEACDVTQEAFLAAYRSLRSFKGEAKFSTWLHRIVINLAKNRLKARQSLTHRETVLPDNPDDPAGCALCLAAADEDDPGRALERRELEAQVQKCIDALDNDFRTVLVLRDIQGLAYDEIQSVLSIPDGTVKSRLARARLAMKDCLKKVMGDL